MFGSIKGPRNSTETLHSKELIAYIGVQTTIWNTNKRFHKLNLWQCQCIKVFLIFKIYFCNQKNNDLVLHLEKQILKNYQKAYNVKLQFIDYNNSYILNIKIILGVILKCYLQGAEDGTVGLQLEVIQTAYLE